MQFCTDCGTVLDLFGGNDREFCSACIQQKKLNTPAPHPVEKSKIEPIDRNLLADVILSCKGDKIVLTSREGWELWCAPIQSHIDLQSILARAEKVYQIRLKRQKN